MGHREWEGPKVPKQPKESSGKPDGRTVGIAATLFIILPLSVVATIVGYFAAHIS